jgi:hypothetical protein
LEEDNYEVGPLGQNRGKSESKQYYCFRSWLKPKEIEIQFIETSLQEADMLTKSLPTESLVNSRENQHLVSVQSQTLITYLHFFQTT